MAERHKGYKGRDCLNRRAWRTIDRIVDVTTGLGALGGVALGIVVDASKHVPTLPAVVIAVAGGIAGGFLGKFVGQNATYFIDQEI